MLKTRLAVLASLALVVAGCSGGGAIEDQYTFAEFEQVAREGQKCLDDAGLIGEIRYSEEKGYTGAGFEGDPNESDIDKCLDPVNEANSQYLKTKVPTGAERDRQIGELIACLEATGVTTVTPADFESGLENSIVRKLVEHNLEIEGEEFPFRPGLECLDEYDLLFPSQLG